MTRRGKEWKIEWMEKVVKVVKVEWMKEAKEVEEVEVGQEWIGVPPYMTTSGEVIDIRPV